MANVNWNAIPEDKRPKQSNNFDKRVQAIENATRVSELNHKYRMKILDKIEAGTYTDEDREIFELLDKNIIAMTKLIINL